MSDDRMEHRVVVSATEFSHYRRLVDFLVEASVHADGACDSELREMVDQCRRDLAELSGNGDA